MIHLDVISDPICPWCFIGKTRLEKALEKYPEPIFDIEWHPYMLNPDMPPEGMDRRAYLEQKFGGREGAASVYGQIADAARETGIDIDFDAIQRTPSTLDAHRLIHWAGIEGVQNAVVDGLFRAYFQQGKDISDPAVLSEVAAQAGMDAQVVTRLLAQDVDREGIRQRAALVRERGVQGVPCFIIDNSRVVQGAHPAETWVQLIDQMTAPPTEPPTEPDQA